MIYDLQPFTSEYRAVASGGMAAVEQRDGFIGARRSDGCSTSTMQGDSIAADLPAFHVYDIQEIAGVFSCLVKIGRVQGRNPTLAANAIPVGVLPTISGTAMATTRITIEAAKSLYCRVATGADDIPTSATIVSETPTPSSTHAQPAQHNLDGAQSVSPVTGIYYYRIANFVVDATGRMVVSEQFQSGGPIIHAPGRNGHATTLHFYDCDGNNVARIVSNQGLVETNLGHQDIQSGCQDGTSSFSGSHY